MSFDLLQVFVELGNLHGTSNYAFYRIHWVASSDSISIEMNTIWEPIIKNSRWKKKIEYEHR